MHDTRPLHAAGCNTTQRALGRRPHPSSPASPPLAALGWLGSRRSAAASRQQLTAHDFLPLHPSCVINTPPRPWLSAEDSSAAAVALPGRCIHKELAAP